MRQVIASDPERLSKAQRHVFDKYVIGVWVLEGCSDCRQEIPWCEMLHAVDYDGLCSWCFAKREKSRSEA